MTIIAIEVTYPLVSNEATLKMNDYKGIDNKTYIPDENVSPLFLPPPLLFLFPLVQQY